MRAHALVAALLSASMVALASDHAPECVRHAFVRHGHLGELDLMSGAGAATPRPRHRRRPHRIAAATPRRPSWLPIRISAPRPPATIVAPVLIYRV